MYRYPITRFVTETSIPRQLLHIASEILEIIIALCKGDLEHAVHESFDAIHSLETLIRKLVIVSWQRGNFINSTLIGQKIEQKNRDRGYYAH